MSIKPCGYMWAGVFIPAKESQPWHRKEGNALCAIPDTHRVVSVEFLQDLLTDAYLHPHDSAVALKLCEIIDVK